MNVEADADARVPQLPLQADRLAGDDERPAGALRDDGGSAAGAAFGRAGSLAKECHTTRGGSGGEGGDEEDEEDDEEDEEDDEGDEEGMEQAAAKGDRQNARGGQAGGGGTGQRRRGGTVAEKEHKRLKRLLRNRVSAQQARERRKAYLSELEGRSSLLEQRNAELKERLSTLQRENIMLRQVARSAGGGVEQR